MSAPHTGDHPILLDHFWRYCSRGGQVSAVLYLLFLATFLALGLWIMAAITGLVLTAVLVGLSRIPWKHKHLYQMAMVASIVGFSIFAMWGVGPNAEFHLYTIALLSIVSGYGRFKLMKKAAVIVLIILFFAVLERWFRTTTPMWPLAPGALHTVRAMNLVGLCAFIAAISYQGERTMEILTHSLLEMATRDPLTGLLNRRRMEEMAAMVQNSHERHRRPFIVILGDLDHFKQINDRHSHAGGDLALRAVAECMLGSVRAEDQVARWGGEEFLILLPETSLEEGLQVAERIREGVARLQLRFQDQELPVSITLGICQGGPERSFSQALGGADEALYRGKAAGRNRVQGG